VRFDPYKYQYPSRRNLVYGGRGMVATTNPYASQAGLDMIKAGGNAFDGAVAAAAVLTVVEPTSNGLGSDAFAILYSGGRLHGINGSGHSPEALTMEYIRDKGLDRVPMHGSLPVMVPGAVGAWAEIIDKCGNLTLEEVLQPAIRLAEEGYCVQATIAENWARGLTIQETLKEDHFRHWYGSFTKGGRTPYPGELWKSPDMGKTLRSIARTGGEDFYRGELAQRISEFLQESGGVMTVEDLADYRPEWVEPLSVNFRGYDIWELPPNGHGINVLLALDIMKNLPQGGFDDPESVHRAIEAMKLGFEDGMPLVGDPRFCQDRWVDLLKGENGVKRAGGITGLARTPLCGDPGKGGTVYLAAADGEGNMISFIQSNFRGFGSGLVVPGTGISLNNRGTDFSMDNHSPNALMGRKRPYHTIIPGFITKNGKAIGPFGVMGAYMQPQGHLQVLLNTIDYGMNPQSALDAPRWQWTGGMEVHIEEDFPSEIAQALEGKGHRIAINRDTSFFGRGQMIIRTGEGQLCGATEKRADSSIAVW